MSTKTDIKPRRRLLNLVVLATLGGGALAPLPASAADLYWACGSASWDATCWSSTPGGGATLGPPQDGDNGFQNAGSLTVSGELALGQNSGSTGSYNLSGGSLSAVDETIGLYGAGVFTQTGGVNSIDGKELLLGYFSGSNGTYDLSGTGSLLSAPNEVIGIFGTGTFTQSGGTHTVSSVFYLGYSSGSNGTYYLNGGDLLASMGNGYGPEIIGVLGTGTFNQGGGTHTANELVVGLLGNGSYSLSAGNLSANSETIGYSGGTGTFTQTGGAHEVTGTMTLAANPFSLGTGLGTYNFTGGTLTAGAIVNNVGGEFNQSGATTVTVTTGITNNGSYNVSGGGVATVAGDFTNNATGTVKTTGTTAIFTGTFINLGTYQSDPADNYFTDLIVGSTGYLAGGTGDNFFIANNFTNDSANALWNTQNARLVFDTGTDSLHDFTLGGLAGTDPFSWGTLELTSGNMLNLFGSSLYVDTLVLGSGADINLDGITLYYRHLLNNGGAIGYSHGGQFLAWGGGPSTTPVPEPETWAMLLAGLGLLGFAGRRRN